MVSPAETAERLNYADRKHVFIDHALQTASWPSLEFLLFNHETIWFFLLVQPAWV